jgi:catechol 2,3-dioxygenase-like lactoylglutathione lyase family enzyme
MLAYSRLVPFIATKNPKASKEFYQKALGLDVISESPYAVVFKLFQTQLRVTPVQKFKAASHTILGWETKNIKKEIGELKRAGVHFEKYLGMNQDDLGIWISPSGAMVAWFKDPDGNVLSLTEYPIIQKARRASRSLSHKKRTDLKSIPKLTRNKKP